MKKLILFSIALTAFNSFAQNKDDNTLVFKNFDKENFQVLENILITGFYQIDSFDKDKYTFTTREKPLEGSIYAYDLKGKIHGFMMNNDLFVYATYDFRGGMMEAETYSGRARWSKRPNTGATIVFNEMVKVMMKTGLSFDFMKL